MPTPIGQCIECKKWFPITEVVFVPVEGDNFGFYLCHHDGLTYYAKKYAALETAAHKILRCHSVQTWLTPKGDTEITYWGSTPIPAYDVESDHKRDKALFELAALLSTRPEAGKEPK